MVEPFWRRTGSGARRSPSFLVLDLAGDGIYLSDVYYPFRLAWTTMGCDDAFLWLDVNANGVVDDGTELLLGMPNAPDVWVQDASVFRLAVLFDVSGDEKLSAADPVWDRLGVWVDRDQDGRSEPQELSRLSASNVVEIGLGYWPVGTTDGSLNRVKSASTFQQIETVASRESTVLSHEILEIQFKLLDNGD